MLLNAPIENRPPSPRRNFLRGGALLSLLLTLICTSCRTGPPLPPADVSSPGWSVRQGQAIWKPDASRPELVGELLLATSTNGDFLVQFTKTPFALATAQVAGDRWQIDFATGKYVWRGKGEPPKRFVWFELPRVLDGATPDHGWQFTKTNGQWRLERPKSGESLEGQFFP